MKLVHTLDDIRPEDVEIHGGKAVNLARLSNLGFLVPMSFSVSSVAFTQMLENNQKLLDLEKFLSMTSMEILKMLLVIMLM